MEMLGEEEGRRIVVRDALWSWPGSGRSCDVGEEGVLGFLVAFGCVC